MLFTLPWGSFAVTFSSLMLGILSLEQAGISLAITIYLDINTIGLREHSFSSWWSTHLKTRRWREIDRAFAILSQSPRRYSKSLAAQSFPIYRLKCRGNTCLMIWHKSVHMPLQFVMSPLHCLQINSLTASHFHSRDIHIASHFWAFWLHFQDSQISFMTKF